MFTRERVRNWLIALGWIALFLAVMPYFHHKMGSVQDSAAAEFVRDQPDLYPSSSVYRFGWSDSPLVQYVSEQTVEGQGSSGFTFKRTSHMTFGWFTWSSLTLVIGLVLLRVARALKPTPPTAVPTS